MVHINACKATVTKRLLFISSKLHSLSEVHEGIAIMEWMAQRAERERYDNFGITSFKW
ncbi:MAG: hypothetical protein ACTS5A_02055 [Candidatus Hodgkinia cicadicola]